MEKRIQEKLQAAENQYGVFLLLACETGSRAWGFPSPDSNYDVRFINRHPKDGYLSIDNPRDTIELLSGDLALVGWGPEAKFKGIMPHGNANDISLSSIPKNLDPVALMSFNENGYATYCKEYRDYWEWVKKRNEARYQNTLSHGKNYDAKNLMHTFRLLAMAEEIARGGRIMVRRPDREFLLQIRSGAFAYSELVAMAHRANK